jgi:cell division septation protein DedD
MPRERGATAARMAAAEAAQVPAQRRQTVAATTTVPKGAWVIQLGAFDNDAAARAKLSKAQDRAKRVVADASAFTEPVATNGGTLFRARFGGFDSVDDAKAACSALKRMDFACVPMKP